MVARLLAILITVLSIAFLGFAFAAWYGGPNWRATARSMKEYKFEQTGGDNPQWTVTSPSGESAGSSPVLPGVVSAALDHKIKQLQTRLDELNAREPQLQQNLQTLGQQIEADRAALAASIQEKEQTISELQQQYADLSGQVIEQVAQGTAVEQIVSDRRADIFRLRNQLEVLRADEAYIAQIHRQMTDLIEQIDGDLTKARRREAQLRSRLGQ